MRPPRDDRQNDRNFEIGTICVEKDHGVDGVLEEVVGKLKQEGVRVAGFLQCEEDTGSSACCSEMYLKDIASGGRFSITQSLGSGAQGCKLDPFGLANAVNFMSGQIDNNIDLLVLNRFGKGEEEGRGFRPVIEAACVNNTPVLIVVRGTYFDAWRQFVGEEHSLLSANAADILRWCRVHCGNADLSEPA